MFDKAFKQIARTGGPVELAQAKGSIQEAAASGIRWDNAIAESFFKTLKSELVHHMQFATRAAARLAIFEYIESWYNRQRKHSVLGYRTPSQQESYFYSASMAA